MIYYNIMQYSIRCELAERVELILCLRRFKLNDWMSSVKDKKRSFLV